MTELLGMILIVQIGQLVVHAIAYTYGFEMTIKSNKKHK